MRITSLLALILSIQITAFSANIHVPKDQPTIQTAINAAVAGDIIVVAPGTYRESIDFHGKAITVRSDGGPQVTTIDAASLGRTVTFTSGEGGGSVLKGFTLAKGDDHLAGAILCIDSSPMVTENVIKSRGVQAVAAVFCRNSFARIERNDISDNPVVAVFCDTKGGPVIVGNCITNNNSAYAGGVYCNDSSPVIDGNLITGNLSNGITCTVGSEPVITGNTISGNTTAGSGGAIWCDRSSPVIEGNRISGNSAGIASAIMCSSLSAPLITGNRISENTSTDGTICCYWASSPTITFNVVIGNSVRYGGGLICHDGSNPLSACNVISDNDADIGGGIWCYAASPEIVNNTITGNVARIEGGGISCIVGSSPNLSNTIFWDNSAPSGPQIYVANGSTPTFTHCAVQDGWPGSGNISLDPLFADPAGGDRHLTWNSPCREAGTGSTLPADLVADFEGDPRVAFGSVDIGADEFHRHLYHVGDATPGGTVTLKVAGVPTAPVMLAFGAGLADPPYQTRYGAFYLSWPVILVPIGSIGSSGNRTFPMLVPAAWSPGEVKPLQALLGHLGGFHSKLTNLDLLVVE